MIHLKILSNSTINSVKVKVNVEFYDEKGELITASPGTTRFVI
jgi:hypothetical protein